MAWIGRKGLLAALLGTALLLLYGCGSIPSIEGPAPAFSSQSDLDQLKAHFAPYTSVESYYATSDPAKRRAQRDQFIAGRLIIYDIEYAKWVSQFALTRAEIDSVLDITKLALDISTASFGSAYDKSILGAISGLLSGGRLSIEKNFFDQSTAHALIAQMNAQRKAVLVRIRAGLAMDVDKYTFEDALGDTNDYYSAGTLEGALQAIQAQADQVAQKADKDLKRLRESKFGDDSNTNLILTWLYPGYVSTDAAGNRLDKDGKAIQVIQANLDSLRKWKSTNAPDIGMGDLLDGDQFADIRKKAVDGLKIGK